MAFTVEVMQSKWHERLCGEGWTAATKRFWEETPCFYDLGTVKTVLLLVTDHDELQRRYAEMFYWKHGDHNRPEYLDTECVEVRRYKLHHSMNDLLWHDHGNGPMWPR